MTTVNAYETIKDALEAGRTWGEQEVSLWLDQHESKCMSDAPPWTRGTYCGELPSDESRELIEAVIDLEAERVWNDARESVVA